MITFFNFPHGMSNLLKNLAKELNLLDTYYSDISAAFSVHLKINNWGNFCACLVWGSVNE